MYSKKYHLIIIGGGALGTFHAYHALKKGLSVLLIEKDNTPSSASVRNFGQVVPSGQEEPWWKYGKIGLEVYKEIQRKTNITVRENGATYIASNEGEWQLINELHQIYQEKEYASYLLDKEECLAKIDRLKESYCVGGLYFPQELTVEPREMIQKVIDFLIHDYHLDFLHTTLVKHCDIQDGLCEVIDSKGQKYTAEKVIICNGSEFKILFPELFANSGIKLCKLQMMRTVPMPEVNLQGAILTGLTIRRYEAFHACPSYEKVLAENPKPELQRYGIHILFKQGIDSSIIIGDTHEYAGVKDTESLDFGINTYLNDLMIDEAKQILDLPTWQMQSYWVGYYASHPEGIFEHTISDKIFICTGIGGKGMTTSAGYAQMRIEAIYDTKFAQSQTKFLF
ncbi:TIGR03364 family FAD-dependent oxidoreductase [Thermoflexibacter ruber]|uniref:FAD dependent oxidoreductase TIGR03364 n=1 Tax=Thermoflexibacter ruber TaxID=1003 RepID=A0A1I2J823_9BACT|nr:TIGR03364 family FAD-dependent oxidoreductase [Thermoflexibacter ruber]SFF50895.1 FAD dependent oxidoreductase TIGR03364 [Thermoflexibacter ruber]